MTNETSHDLLCFIFMGHQGKYFQVKNKAESFFDNAFIVIRV